MRQLHGPKPKLMKWIYTGIIRPRITYGAMIRGHCKQSKSMTKQLYNLNRTACMMITTTTRTTPQAALDIHIKEIGLTAYIRLRHQLDKPWTSKMTFAKPHLSC